MIFFIILGIISQNVLSLAHANQAARILKDLEAA
jgi:hypothetical protein